MMGDTLATYPSRSTPGEQYSIIRGKDGRTYCTCWQWKLKRTCSHLKDFMATMTYTARYEKEEDKDVLYLDMAEAIKRAVSELS